MATMTWGRGGDGCSLHICMYVYVFIHIYIYAYTHVSTYIHGYDICILYYVILHIYIYRGAFVCMYAYMCQSTHSLLDFIRFVGRPKVIGRREQCLQPQWLWRFRSTAIPWLGPPCPHGLSSGSIASPASKGSSDVTE